MKSPEGERRDTRKAGISKEEPDSLRGPRRIGVGTLRATQSEKWLQGSRGSKTAKVVETAKADCARRVGPFRENRSRGLMIAEREENLRGAFGHFYCGDTVE